MKPVLVYSKFSDEFRNKVVVPLQSIYSNCQVINLQEAVDYFLTADRKCDAVVVEVSSELDEDSSKQSGATLFRYTCKELLGELICECERFAPIIACYNELELPRLDGTYRVITKNFKSAFITDMLIRWRAGLKPRELSDNQIRQIPNSYDQDYPLPEREVLALLQLELPDLLDQTRLVKHVYDSVERKDVSALIEVLIMMRMTRFLARLELEGRPYVMSFALGTNLQKIKCLYTLRDSMQISLAPTAIPQIEDLAELVQGWGCFVGIDPTNGCINGVYQFPFTETEKLSCFSQLANSVHGIVFNLPGNRTVETYTKSGLSLRYDGFEWVCQPLDKLEEELGKLKLGTIPMQRLMEAIYQLSLRRLSSIIAIDPYDFECEVMEIERGDLRPNCIQTLTPLSELDVETLVSIFRLDGAHLLKRGMFYKIAQQVSYGLKSAQEKSMSSGTGSRAAKVLSEAFPFALVIKVSASGGRIKIYKGDARTLRRLLLDQEKSADFRVEAAKAAAKFTDVEERKIIIPALCSAAKDHHQTIRKEAIKSLGIYREPNTGLINLKNGLS